MLQQNSASAASVYADRIFEGYDDNKSGYIEKAEAVRILTDLCTVLKIDPLSTRDLE